MLNADGVINGNSRTGINGLDYNRQWQDTVSKIPEIYALKEVIRSTQKVREIHMFCDLHGHSRKKDLFIFGCNNNSSRKDLMKERIFPMMFYKNCDEFSYDNCTFDVHPNKASTGRVAVRTEFNIINSFTLECSVSGPSCGRLKGHHFTIQSLK